MREHEAAHFIGLDIGTSEVRCVVGMIESPDANKPSVIGHGLSRNMGMRKGVVVHIDDVTEAITRAVEDAERVSGVHIKHATVNVNGSHITGMNSRGVIAISNANREITGDDRLRVEEAAAIVQIPANREIVQIFAKNYRLDGQDNIKDPVGMHGVRLEVDTHIVTASIPNLKNLDLALEKAQITPSNHVVSSLASAEAVLNRQQKEAGTLLLDIGAGTTNLVVVEDGEVQHIAVLPIGGIHITNDLAIGLKTDLDVAEKVKITHASVLSKQKSGRVSVELNKIKHNFDSEEITMITEARVDELLDYVDKELKRIHKSRKLPGGVVLVGGTANLPGLAEFTKDKLELAARIGKLQDVGGLVDTVHNPRFATAVGLMLLDMLLSPRAHMKSIAQDQAGKANQKALGLVQGIIDKLKRHL